MRGIKYKKDKRREGEEIEREKRGKNKERIYRRGGRALTHALTFLEFDL